MTNARVRAAVLVFCAVVVAGMLLACDDKEKATYSGTTIQENTNIFVNGGGTWSGIKSK